MSEETLKKYRGNCHCGAFVYEGNLPEIKAYSECKCSICYKKGYAWLSSNLGDLDIVKGNIDDLTAYTFKKGDYVHRFCPGCGNSILMEFQNKPGKAIGLNARTIQGLDIWSLDVKPIDGKALGPSYEPPVYNGPEPKPEIEDGNTFHGSCHCGAVTVAVKVKKPLETYENSGFEDRIAECNCSICSRGAFVWIYPSIDSSIIQGREHLTYYAFNNKMICKAFCKNCGVYICSEPAQLTDEEVDAMDETTKAWRQRVASLRPITLRTFNDFDHKGLNVWHGDGWNMIKPIYVNP